MWARVRLHGEQRRVGCVRKAGIADQGYTFHSWRHTFRTRLSEAKVSTELAKKLGGWTVDKTAERYDHAERIEELRAAVEAANAQGNDSPKVPERSPPC